MENSHLPIARKEGLVIQEMPDEVLVYDLNTNKAHCLNETAAMVWKSCDGKNTVSDISQTMAQKLNASVPEDLVWLAIDQLSKDNLLEREIQTKISGMSRREVIKKVGFASMVALPVIGLLSFPKTALGATCRASACGVQADCAPSQICCRGTCQASLPCSPACPA